MKAVHFGAGNIGRGFIGAELQDAGYFVYFADVNQQVIDQLNNQGHYDVIELGENGKTKRYQNFSALNSVSQKDELVSVIASADVVTASVGAKVLPRIAPTIAEALEVRTASRPLVVMACENAVNATDILENEIKKLADTSKAIFCNTAVDRIVPQQSDSLSPSVEVEVFKEWVIETSRLGEIDLKLQEATLVSDLSPYIQRKLFTVNTAHCSVAYLGQQAGFETIAGAMRDSAVMAKTNAVLAETSQYLIAKFGFNAESHQKYVAKTLARLSDPIMDDMTERVGRQPLRKLSRNERLVSPAAGLAELGIVPTALLEVVSAALKFHSTEDEEASQLQEMLRTLNAEQFVTRICGIQPEDALYPHLLKVIQAGQHSTRVASN